MKHDIEKIADECRDKICELQQGRQDETFHIHSRAARQLIAEYIESALNKAVEVQKASHARQIDALVLSLQNSKNSIQATEAMSRDLTEKLSESQLKVKSLSRTLEEIKRKVSGEASLKWTHEMISFVCQKALNEAQISL